MKVFTNIQDQWGQTIVFDDAEQLLTYMRSWNIPECYIGCQWRGQQLTGIKMTVQQVAEWVDYNIRAGVQYAQPSWLTGNLQ